MSNLSLSDAFGAKVRLSMVDRGLYLVIGRTTSPVALVAALDGQVVFQIPNSFSLLSVMHVNAFFSLRLHQDIAHIGPVTVNAERFDRFVELNS